MINTKKSESYMFDKYLFEIIAGVIVLVGLAIYMIFKSNTSDTQELQTEETPEEVVVKQESLEHEIENKIIEDEYDTPLSGSEEGDFGEVETNESNPIAISEDEETQHKVISKRSVPNHGKITKQNFSEFSGERILVAEDNLINQKVMIGLLAGTGIEVVLADDGQIALDILEQDDDFLLILMDAHMPRVDGFEATRIIRQNPKYDHILVVALSGDTASDDIAKMTNAGMDEHLEKPLRMEALYEILYAYTGKEKTTDEDYIEVVMTKELNGDKGLGVCGGDEEFYREILNEFINDYSNSSQKLNDFLQNEQMREADKLLLDIIGITANIGADQLNNIANDIKSSLGDTQEKSYLALANKYKNHLKNLIKDIKDYL